MARRSGLSISVKMILMSTLLVLATAMGLGIMDIAHIEDAYDAMSPSHIAHHEAAREAAEKRAALRIFAASVVCVVLCVTIVGLYGMRICRRLSLLAWTADRIARGELEARADVSPDDEIGALGESFNLMADRVRKLVTDTRLDAALEKELEAARAIQETLVPSEEPVTWGSFSLAGHFQPAARCGGDWWTYHGLADGKLLLLIGDATGHGLPSAMITAAAKAACDVACAASSDDIDVSTLLSLMNRAIYESARRRLVMTCFAAIICPETRVITYANAGHHFPYLYRAGEDGRGEFGSLMIRGNRLGDLKESQYDSKTTQLRPGDTLIWYTDGVIEGENDQGEEYGERRFRASIRQAGHLGAGDLRNSLVGDVMDFFGEGRLEDDITIIVGRVS